MFLGMLSSVHFLDSLRFPGLWHTWGCPVAQSLLHHSRGDFEAEESNPQIKELTT